MTTVDPILRLKEMVAQIKKDPRLYPKKDLVDAAEAVFGSLEDERIGTKASFIAWLINEVETMQVVDIDGPPVEIPGTMPPPPPEPLGEVRPNVVVAKTVPVGLVQVIGKVDRVVTYGRSYKIHAGAKLALPPEAAEFMRSKGFVE